MPTENNSKSTINSIKIKALIVKSRFPFLCVYIFFRLSLSSFIFIQFLRVQVFYMLFLVARRRCGMWVERSIRSATHICKFSTLYKHSSCIHIHKCILMPILVILEHSSTRRVPIATHRTFILHANLLT